MHDTHHQLIKGIAVSPGIVRAPAFVVSDEASLTVSRRPITEGEVAGELAKFDAALGEVEKALELLREEVREKVGPHEAEIFGAQITLLRDPMFVNEVVGLVRSELLNVEAVVADVIERFSQIISDIEDPLLRERASDVRDVGRRVFACLVGRRSGERMEIPEGVILVAPELAPSTAARLDLRGVRAVVTERGGKTSHASILMRSLRIPAVVGAKDATHRIKSGDPLILDGASGLVHVWPDREVADDYARLEADLRDHTEELKGFIDRLATTADGTVINLLANIGKSADVEAAVRYGADGIGLFRTEFSFLIREHLPSADEHYDIYTNLAERIHPREVVVRVLDIGSDKTPAYFELNPEENPSLGLRGTRLLLRHPEVLESQLDAILRVSANHPVSVLFPGIAGKEEIVAAKRVLDRVKKRLAEQGVAFNEALRVGAMIELPAAALRMGPILREVDFVSLGTNDLTQYILAADRSSPEMGEYYRSIHPAVLQTIKQAIDAARAAGRDLTVCGAMAGNPARVGLLIGMGARKLSVPPGDMLEIKRMLSTIDIRDAERLAEDVLALDSIEEIEARLKQEMSRKGSGLRAGSASG